MRRENTGIVVTFFKTTGEQSFENVLQKFRNIYPDSPSNAKVSDRTGHEIKM